MLTFLEQMLPKCYKCPQKGHMQNRAHNKFVRIRKRQTKHVSRADNGLINMARNFMQIKSLNPGKPMNRWELTTNEWAS